MPTFVVSKGHDAFVYYETVVEADAPDEARALATNVHYDGEWLATGYVQEFDDYEIDEQSGVRLLESGETVEALHTITVTAHERDAVLAGLCTLQLALINGPLDPVFMTILTNHGAHAGLYLHELDELCERIKV
ncbi:MAG: hypothetical protein ACK43M_14800 [Allorhizobium sp.]